jgi:hypothetical protein
MITSAEAIAVDVPRRGYRVAEPGSRVRANVKLDGVTEAKPLHRTPIEERPPEVEPEELVEVGRPDDRVAEAVAVRSPAVATDQPNPAPDWFLSWVLLAIRLRPPAVKDGDLDLATRQAPTSGRDDPGAG